MNQRTAVFYFFLLAGTFFVILPVHAAENVNGSPLTILALGDSITAGAPQFKSPAEAPPRGRGNPKSQYVYWLNLKHPEWKIYNRGISGQATLAILNRTEAELRDTRPDLVILMAGVNDIYRNAAMPQTIKNLTAMIKIIRAQGIPVMLLSVLPYRGITPVQQKNLGDLNRWIEDYALRNGLGFCDTFAAMHAPGDAAQLVSTPDGLHPDAAGYRLMGETVAAALEAWPGLPKQERVNG